MIGRILPRLKIIAPSSESMVIFLAIFLFFEGWVLFLESRNIPIAAHLPFRPGRVILLYASVQYGLRRVVAFHPIWQPGYRAWLESTPWTSRKPLPLGPVELVWEDGLILGPLILLCALVPEPRSMYLLCTFLLTHLLALTVTLWLTRMWAIGYATAFVLGLAVWLWRQPIVCLGILVLAYLVAYEGLRRGLERFPWKSRTLPDPSTDLISRAVPAESCGWPYDRMMRDTLTIRGISRVHAVCCCVLGTWWLFVVGSLLPDPDKRAVALTFPFVISTFIFAFGRLLMYVSGYQSPISLWGRIRTFRWIIPGYDYVFIAPICTLGAGPATLMFCATRIGLPPDLALPIATGAVAAVALLAPPRLLRWRLTGRHRLAPMIAPSNSLYVKVG
jgi:hypothetical protein